MKQTPFSARWTIAEDDLIKLKDCVTNESLKTKEISNSSGIKYKLQMYPNGQSAEYRRKVMIYLEIDIGNLRKVAAQYTVRTESANFSHNRGATFKKSTACGRRYCNTAELFDPERKFVVDGKMVLIVDGIFEYDEGINGFWRSCNLTMGNKLWEKDDTKDFLIIASDGKGIKAHKIVLRARSPVFAAMFRSGMKESIENQVEMIDFSSDVIERALMLIYDYADEFEASDVQVMAILQFFDKYDFKSLKDQMEETFFDQIGVSSVCELMNCAIKSNALKLQEKCFQFLIASFEERIPIADLDILDKEVLLKHRSLKLHKTYIKMKKISKRCFFSFSCRLFSFLLKNQQETFYQIFFYFLLKHRR